MATDGKIQALNNAIREAIPHKNLSKDKWVTTSAEGAVKDVEPGRGLTIAVGTSVNFGEVEGQIRS